MSRGAELRALLAARPFAATSGIYSPLQARLAESVGLACAFVSGYSCSLAYLARPDLGFVTMTEMATWARMCAGATRMPLVVDADDGYGDVLQVMRTVELMEQGGLAAMTLEDQVFPKRCGHLPGKRVHPLAASVARIEAALHARSDPSFMIIVRTDVVGADGERGAVEDAVARGVAYADAGADMVWAELATPRRADAEAFAAGMRARHPALPLFFNYSSSFRWTREASPLTFAELGALGYRLIIIGLGAIHAGMRAEHDYLAGLARDGERAQWRLEAELAGHPTESHHRVGGVDHYQALAARFTPEPGR